MAKRSALKITLIAALVLGLAAFLTWPAGLPADVAVREMTLPDPADKPLPLRVWYPSKGGSNLPLIVVSHGTGGSMAGHEDTAIALVRAGFVVAAVTHTGDNYRDTSYVGRGIQFVERSRHIARLIDYMQTGWTGPRIDPTRIGMFGHSAGGFTALVLAGGEPDLTRTKTYCRDRPQAWTCRYLEKHGFKPADRPRPAAWLHDARIKSIAVAAPAVGYSFTPTGLAKVAVPIQLWDAERDVIVDDSARLIRVSLPQAPDYRRVPNAGHFSFMTPCTWPLRAAITAMHWFGTEDICTDPAGFDREQFHADFNRAIAAHFVKTLPQAPR